MAKVKIVRAYKNVAYDCYEVLTFVDSRRTKFLFGKDGKYEMEMFDYRHGVTFQMRGDYVCSDWSSFEADYFPELVVRSLIKEWRRMDRWIAC